MMEEVTAGVRRPLPHHRLTESEWASIQAALIASDRLNFPTLTKEADAVLDEAYGPTEQPVFFLEGAHPYDFTIPGSIMRLMHTRQGCITVAKVGKESYVLSIELGKGVTPTDSHTVYGGSANTALEALREQLGK